MKHSKDVLLLIFVFFVSCFSISIVNASTLDANVLNEKITNIKFDSGNSIVMGNLADNLTVEQLLKDFTPEFVLEYDIKSVDVIDGEDVLSNDDVVTNNMDLVIECNDDSSMAFSIYVVGDLTNDGIVNDDDVNALIDDILKPESEQEEDESTIEKDVNEDSNVDVVDVTEMNYSIGNGNWGIGQVELEDIISSLGADDIVYVDDTIEVIYKVTGLKAGIFKGISGIINYDKSLLELDSVFASSVYGYLNDDGKFLYVFDENTEEVLITFSFKVTARGTGSTDISLSDLMAAIDGVEVELDQDTLSKGVQIEEYGKGGDEEEETSTEDTAEEVVSTPVVTPDRKSTRLNSSHPTTSRMPSSA